MMAPMAAQKKSLYEILGVPRDANSLDIGLAFQKRDAELQRAVPQDASAMALLHQANEILSNPKRRAAYDASLVTAAEKAAAAEQGAPDLVLETGEEDKPDRKKVLIPVVAGLAVILIALILIFRPGRAPDTAPKAEPVAEAPKPAPPPPPPQPLNAPQILRAALLSVGRVMSYEMSGRAVAVGLAVAVEPGSMITTCHAIPAGSKLVVRYGTESLSADLSTDDEVLDLCKVTVTGLNARPLAIAGDEVKAGDKIFALGVNQAGDFALTEGTVKQVRMGPSVKLLEVSMPIAPNGTGGAVFDTYGRLAGIATTPHKFGTGLQVAIASSWISQMRSRDK
jgi:S1-C subfamily serine protease